MRTAEIDKANWELQAIRVFITWFNKNDHQLLSISHQNRPAKPDVTCKLDGEQVDIEIAHLYGSDKEAMKILGRKLDSDTRIELRKLERGGHVESRLLLALNRILEQKASKQYQSHRIWLVIRNAHPAWSCTDIQTHIQQLKIPEIHPFQRIWVIGDLTAASGAIQIYPQDGEYNT